MAASPVAASPVAVAQVAVAQVAALFLPFFFWLCNFVAHAFSAAYLLAASVRDIPLPLFLRCQAFQEFSGSGLPSGGGGGAARTPVAVHELREG